ncbi:MAG TPA: glutaminyl-peptide cyclotransferase [Thermomicrobiales bacterium]
MSRTSSRATRLRFAALLLAIISLGPLSYIEFSAIAEEAAPVAGYHVVQSYPHDPDAFTQGLVYDDGLLLEGTGREGKSTLRLVELETGEVLRSVALDTRHFGEGIALLGSRIYQLTWKSRTCFVYDRETFELLTTFEYEGEGWGLTTDGEQLIMSDGSSTLTFRDPETFRAVRQITVEDAGKPVMLLNELEYIGGEIWANVWRTDRIVRIDPETGEVRGWIDLSGLLTPEDRGDHRVDVLNGIAYDPATNRIFVTGKLWPKLYEIEIVPAPDLLQPIGTPTGTPPS